VPRVGLNSVRVIEEAEAVVDELGLSNLTLSAIASRLGVQIPSLYKHVPGMAALQREVGVRAKNDLAITLARAAVGRAGYDAILAVAIAYRSWAKQHPGRYATTLRAPAPDEESYVAASNEVLRVVSDVFVGFDLAGDDLIDAIRALRATLHGFIELELAGGFGLPVDVDRSFERAVRTLAIALTEGKALS
jgi:AcrR family transcriptional regulator